MKNIVLKVIIAIAIVTCSFGEAMSQASFLGNNSANPNHFVGWDLNVLTFPLEIRHDAEQPILFSTFGNENMEITSYRNVGVGTDGLGVRPKLYSFLDPGNVSLGQGPFASMALRGENNYRW